MSVVGMEEDGFPGCSRVEFWQPRQLVWMNGQPVVCYNNACERVENVLRKLTDLALILPSDYTAEGDCKCQVCGELFTDGFSLSQHAVVHRERRQMHRHSPQLPLTRSKTLRRLRSSSAAKLPAQPNRVVSRKFQTCSVCFKRMHPRSLPNHMRTHTGSRPFVCPVCNFRFRQLAHMNTHLRRVHGKSPFRQSRLRYGNFPQTPAAAETSVWSSSAVDGGSFSQHPRAVRVPCRVCSKPISAYNVAAHERRHVGHKLPRRRSDRKPPVPRVKNLARDNNISAGDGSEQMPFVCHICDRRFRRRSFLALHMRSHRRGKQFSCQKCGRKFFSGLQFVKHPCSESVNGSRSRSVVASPRQLRCNVCQKSFNCRSRLAMHMETHRPGKRFWFSCDACGEKFYHRFRFKQHVVECERNRNSASNTDHLTSSAGASSSLKKSTKPGQETSDSSRLRTARQKFLKPVPGTSLGAADDGVRQRFIHRGQRSPDSRSDKVVQQVGRGDGATTKTDCTMVLPFQCRFCGQSFKYRFNLLLHTKIHQGTERPSYNSSGRKFLDKSRRQQHPCTVGGASNGGHSNKIASSSVHSLTPDNPADGSVADLVTVKLEDAESTELDSVQAAPTEVGVFSQGKQRSPAHIASRFLNVRKNISSDIEQKDGSSESNPVRKGRFTCSVCSKTFHRNNYLMQHMQMHTAERKYKCSICGASFIFNSGLHYHRKSIHGGHVKKHKCNICGMTFTVASNMRRHRTSVHGEQWRELTATRVAPIANYACSVCNKICSSNRCLKQHMAVHTGDKKFNCSLCDMSFTFVPSLRSHQRKVHCIGSNNRIKTPNKPVRTARYACSVCKKLFRSAFNVKQHMAFHTREKKYSCSICSTSYRYASGLRAHRRLSHRPGSNHSLMSRKQTGIGSFTCTVCKKSFQSRQYLNMHMAVHTREKKYSGTTCGRSFAFPSNMYTRIKSAHGKKPGGLSRVQKTFLTTPGKKTKVSQTKSNRCNTVERLSPNAAKKAMRVVDDSCDSSGSRKWKCSMCGKRFKWRYLLLDHVRRHTGDKPHQCNICRYRAVARNQLALHYMRIHGKKLPPNANLWTPTADAKELDGDTMDNTENNCRNEKQPDKGLRPHQRLSHRPESSRSLSMSRKQTGVGSFTCTVCKKSCQSRQYLNMHMAVHTREKKYSCTTCGRSFAFPSSMYTHIRSAHGKQPGGLSRVRKTFLRTPGKKTAVSRKKSNGCNTVEKLSPNAVQKAMDAAVDHSCSSSERRKWECSDCGKRFKLRCLLLNHVCRFTRDKPPHMFVTCNICRYRSVTESQLAIHYMRIHGKKLPSNNNIRMPTVDANELDRDTADNTENNCPNVIQHDEEKPVIPLSTDSGTFRSSDTFTEDAAPEDIKLYLQQLQAGANGLPADRFYPVSNSDCSTSKEVSPTASEIHCTICDKKVSRSYYGIHLRVHSVQRMFTCRVCWQRFSQRSLLQRHKATFCKGFHDTTNGSDISERSETTAFRTNYRKPYRLVLNGSRRGFWNATSDDTTSVTNPPDWKCRYCSRVFTRKYWFLRHMASSHSQAEDPILANGNTGTKSASMHVCRMSQFVPRISEGDAPYEVPSSVIASTYNAPGYKTMCYA